MAEPRQHVYSYEIRPDTYGVSVGELWHYRHLALLLAWRNVRARYKQTFLGMGWAVLAPLGYTLIFVLLFRLTAVKASGNLPYIPTVFAGMILWQLFSRGLADAGTSLSVNANLITKVYFPRLLLPASSVLSGIADFLVALVLLGLLLAWYSAVPPFPRILAAPLFVVLVLVFTLAGSLWLSALDGVFRDLRHAVPLLLQLGMFICPVAYTTAAIVPERWLWLYEFNPMVACLEGFRWTLLQDAPAPSASALGKGIALTILLMVSGVYFFARVESTVADRV